MAPEARARATLGAMPAYSAPAPSLAAMSFIVPTTSVASEVMISPISPLYLPTTSVASEVMMRTRATSSGVAMACAARVRARVRARARVGVGVGVGVFRVS